MLSTCCDTGDAIAVCMLVFRLATKKYECRCVWAFGLGNKIEKVYTCVPESLAWAIKWINTTTLCLCLCVFLGVRPG